MIRVMIADDEPFIRSCLVHGIDWEENGFEIVMACKDGREVVENLERMRPDVLITDIKMPYMDGLELLTYMRDNCEEIHTLVISGYEEFDYVRHAIECNADGYLLKPINPDELLEKMHKIRHVVLREKRARARKNDPKYIVSRVLHGEDIYVDVGSLADRIAELDALFYVVACVPMENRTCFTQAAEILSAFEDCENGLYFFRRILHSSVFLISASDVNACRMRAEVVAKRIEGGFTAKHIGDYRVGVSNAYEGIDAIPHALEEASRIMVLRSAVNSKRVFYSWEKYGAEYLAFREDIAAIVQAVRKRNTAQAHMLLEAIFALFEKENCPFRDIRMFSENLLYTLTEDESFSTFAKKDERYAECLVRIYLADDARTLFAVLKEIFDCAIDSGAMGRDNTVDALIDEAKRYIEDNIAHSDLSLNKIARHLHHNPSYFCYVFSSVTGMTLSKYIAAMRISHARRELKNSDRRILDIGERVGYVNANYFGRIFKRETGMTPKEYRQKFRGGK